MLGVSEVNMYRSAVLHVLSLTVGFIEGTAPS